jgi:hypothetical protein
MRRPPARVAALFAGVVVLAVAVAALVRTDDAFTLGVTNGGAVAPLRPGATACQTGIVVPPHAGFDRIVFSLGTYGRSGPPVDVAVRDDATHAVLAHGRLAGGYPDIGRAPEHTVRVGDVAAGRHIAVCFTDRGDRRVAVYGNAGIASRPTSAVVAGKPADADLNVRFEREPRSVLSLAPAIAERAALFRPGWVGAWTYALLAALMLLVVPALLVRALQDATAGS